MNAQTQQAPRPLPRVVGPAALPATVERRPRLALSIAEAAESLGISKTHVRTLVHNGTLPAVRLGRRVLIRPADLKALMRRPEREARA